MGNLLFEFPIQNNSTTLNVIFENLSKSVFYGDFDGQLTICSLSMLNGLNLIQAYYCFLADGLSNAREQYGNGHYQFPAFPFTGT